MPDKVAEHQSEFDGEAGEAVPHKRLRPRWQRWLLWSSVRLLVLAGAGAGVGTLQMRARPPDLMRHAKRIASIAHANGYYWTPKGELRLFRYTATGAASLKWDQATQTATFVESLKPTKGERFFNPMREMNPNVQTIRWENHQPNFQIMGVYKKEPSFTPGKPASTPDYTWKIKAMPGFISSFNNVALSSDGKQIAYSCHIPRIYWNDVLMQRLRPRYQAPFRGQGAAVLISSVDGSRTEILGTVKEDSPAPHTQYSRSGTTASLQHLCWCPGGKHLSFMYGDGVWEVPVK